MEALAPLTPPQPHGLAVLLQLRDQRIAMLHDTGVLLVLIVRSVCLDNAVDPVDGAGNAVAGDELGQIPIRVNQSSCPILPSGSVNVKPTDLRSRR